MTLSHDLCCCPQAGDNAAAPGAVSAVPQDADEAERVRHLYLCQGLSTHRIAGLAGLSRRRVGRLLKQAGVAVTPRGAGRSRRPSAELAALAETMEDLYVRPDMRSRGYGRALLAGLAQICVQRGYRRLEWAVLDWNSPALGFYGSLGAVGMDEWTVHRLAGAPLRALAAAGPP